MFAFWLCVTYINSFESIVCKPFDMSIFYLPQYLYQMHRDVLDISLFIAARKITDDCRTSM